MKYRRNAVLVTPTEVTVVEKDENERILDFCYKNIECDMIECIHPHGLPASYVMIDDEEFLLKAEQPEINFIASWLYGTAVHLHPICGNVLIMRQGAYDFELLTKNEADALCEQLKAVAGTARIMVASAYAMAMAENDDDD